METYRIPCDPGKTEAAVEVEGSLEDNATGFTRSVCPGCSRLKKQPEFREKPGLDSENKPKWEQMIVDPSRFKDRAPGLIVLRCIPVGSNVLSINSG